jgi:hypothetical protein
MKRISRRNALILLSIGLFVIAITQIISRYVGLSDLLKGSLVGIGFGLLILSVIFGKFKTVY